MPKRSPIESEIRPQDLYVAYHEDGRKDSRGSFYDVFEGALDLEDLARQYHLEPTPARLKDIAQKAFDDEFAVLEREGLKEDWFEQTDGLEELVELGGDRERAYADYQVGYRDVSVQTLIDEILEKHQEMLDEDEFA